MRTPTTTEPVEQVEQIGYLCIQGYPKRICSGCTSACCEPVFAYPIQPSGAVGEERSAHEGQD